MLIETSTLILRLTKEGIVGTLFVDTDVMSSGLIDTFYILIL